MRDPGRPATEGGRSQIVLIIPTLNEEQAISATLARVPRSIVDRIIVADGGSRDATRQRAEAAGAEIVDAGRGYGRACLRGAEQAGRDDILVYMDGDGSDPVEAIDQLVRPIVENRADFVIGSRVRGERERGSMGLHQVGAGLVVGAALRLLYGVRYTDMCAFRAIRRRTLLDLGMRDLAYGWNLEMQMRAARSGLRVLEVPVPYFRRVAGESKVAGSLRGTLRAGTRILLTLARVASERGAPRQVRADRPKR